MIKNGNQSLKFHTFVLYTNCIPNVYQLYSNTFAIFARTCAHAIIYCQRQYCTHQHSILVSENLKTDSNADCSCWRLAGPKKNVFHNDDSCLSDKSAVFFNSTCSQEKIRVTKVATNTYNVIWAES